jgi:hypothetical protein
MKTITKLLVCIVIFALFMQENLFSQAFEGKINIKLVNDEEVSTMDYLVKGNKIRMEMKSEEGEGEAVMITDMQDLKMIILMAEEKMYMEYPIKEAIEEQKDDIQSEMGKIRLTDETKTINGFNCQKLDYEDDKNIESWITKDIGTLMLYENPMGGNEMPEWYSDFADEGFFPILVIEKDDSGEEESRWEVTSVEKKSLSDDLFIPPAGYQKMEIPMMDFLK